MIYIYIHFALEKETGKVAILRKHVETLCYILNKSIFSDKAFQSYSFGLKKDLLETFLNLFI